MRITEFQSVRDSNEFEIGDITCLVGKNESGKTAVLQALYRLNPVVAEEGTFDVTDDYPRADVEEYRHAVDAGQRDPATVARATFVLDDDELAAIEAELGAGVCGAELRLSKGYENKLRFGLSAHEDVALTNLVENADLLNEVKERLNGLTTAAEALEVLEAVEQTAAVKQLRSTLQAITKRGLDGYIYNTHLASRVPRFLYFDEYYQMRGGENIEALKQRRANNALEKSDHPMLGLIALARLELDDLLNPQRTQELINRIEGAGNHLTKQVMKYWSQNKHLAMKFDVREARPGDPEHMRNGTNIWALVYDSRHMVTTNVGTRSRGFVWFFSFLAWYSQLKREGKPLILLLDEPGLFLHGKAQGDLLRYFEQELQAEHQLIYTTHSPFMVDPGRWDRARIVQDKGIDTLEPLPPEEEGTKVFTDVLQASADSLFPLQGALGYEIHQTLFIGPNCLIVEGVSDLLYLQTVSGILERAGREGLRQGPDGWTITPVGGADKVPTFVALIGAQKSLELATLIDIDKSNEQAVENLYKKRLLKKKRVLTFADFTGTRYADVEDMFDVPFYLDLVNEEYKAVLAKPIREADLTSRHPRVLARLEEYLDQNPLKGGATFSHYRPARLFAESASFASKLSDAALDRFEEAFKRLNRLLPG